LSRISKKLIDDLCKKLDAFENCYIANDDHAKHQKPEMTDEERYQMWREEWFFHPSSWYWRGVDGYDGRGCNQFTGCVRGCRFYGEKGSISKEELHQGIEEKRTK
jgi:hypothetical protein